MYRITLYIFLSLTSSLAFAQSKFTLSGTVKDAKTGELMVGATVRIRELTNAGMSCNEYGFYSLTIPQGSYTLSAGMMGYETQEVKVVLISNQKIDFRLSEEAALLNEVVVKASAANENVSNPAMGFQKLNMKEVNQLPVLLGERDPLKIIQLLPGIKSAGEGSSGFNVRGGNVNQNLILLDEAPVYNASHLLGFFSTFNADAIKDLSIYKGNSPAQYGGRLSSVLDIKMNDGNNQDYKIGGGIGLIASHLSAEGPIQKGKSSFLVTGRRTYADAFLKLSNNENLNKNTLYFYDLNAKLNYTFSDKDRLYVSGYFGRDKFGINDLFAIDWGNATGTLRWNHLYSEKLFSNTSLIYSKYSYKVGVANGSSQFNLSSDIQDINLKQEFSYFPNPQNSIRFGANVIHHTLTPRTRESTGENSSVNTTDEPNKTAFESALYASNRWSPTEKFNVEYGLRLSAFTVMGGSDFYEFDAAGNIVNTLKYDRNEAVTNYFNLEPRISASYLVSPTLSIKAAYSRNTQHLHLLSSSNAASPTDRWLMNTNNIKPELADQISIGVFKNLENNPYEFSLEMYYKSLQNQVDYKDGADFILSDNIESQLLFGKGRAYGAEFLVKKKSGKLTGWIGYTLSRSERQIEGINNGAWYAAKQDRTHDVSIVGTYQLSKKWTLSGTWVYNTGNAVTFPTAKYRIDGGVAFLYSERNGYRMPDYHRLDVGATVNFNKKASRESSLSLGMYNAYGRSNPYAYNFGQSIDNPEVTEVSRVTLFQYVPYLTYNFKF
ncbi:MAG: TonB-dependent receptor [Spirosomataceae bacterium]